MDTFQTFCTSQKHNQLFEKVAALVVETQFDLNKWFDTFLEDCISHETDMAKLAILNELYTEVGLSGAFQGGAAGAPAAQFNPTTNTLGQDLFRSFGDLGRAYGGMRNKFRGAVDSFRTGVTGGTQQDFALRQIQRQLGDVYHTMIQSGIDRKYTRSLEKLWAHLQASVSQPPAAPSPPPDPNNPTAKPPIQPDGLKPAATPVAPSPATQDVPGYPTSWPTTGAMAAGKVPTWAQKPSSWPQGMQAPQNMPRPTTRRRRPTS